ncbi:divergent protein kinase domain 1C isoform X2 [Syngnathoides biaculeatus]|uniref:divergent protein kinase domain 1C isoform X2 n=1 Tax=Syngnathoides biaculeatus TaxID=300417 RepID=UPI002ADE7D4C|nr:divergent protein kinase domain 1C isoform X2 [Syngnathoides biaculeatus]
MSRVGVRCCRLTLALLLAWSASRLLLGGPALLPRADSPSDACTDAAGEEILRRLCGDFAAGLAAGDMCADLCVGGLVEYKRCLYYQSGKKVMEVRWRGRPVVLKSELENLSSYRPLGPLDYQDAAGDASPLDVVLRAAPEIFCKCRYGGQAEGDRDRDRDQDEEGGAGSPPKLRPSDRKIYTRAELTSLWSLLQQDEVLQDLSAHVAKVVGSCGHFYAVEWLSAGHAWDRDVFSADGDEGEGGRGSRVHRIALSFLDMVRHFDDDFAHKVHLCDVKPENFAIRTDLTVVAIDVDMAFFQPKMEEMLDRECGGDDDCGFFDCASSCDLGARRCRRRRANTNLQVICQKIFGLWFSPTLLGAKAGLPLQVELQRAVRECSESGVGGGAGRDVHRRLFDILTRLLHEGGKSDEGRVPLNF